MDNGERIEMKERERERERERQRERDREGERECVCLFCLVDFLTSLSTTRLYRGTGPKTERLTILRAVTHATELGDHDFCLSRSHYTDTDPTSRERTATAGIEPGTSSKESRALD